MAKGRKTGGRKKGVANRVTTSIKEAFKQAFDERGGVPKLLEWAEQEPTAFYNLIGRLVPTEMTGPEGGPLTITIVRK